MAVELDRATGTSAEERWGETIAGVRAFIASRVGNDHVAADIIQDVLVRSVAAGALDHVDNPAAWLYRAARNAVIDHYRTRHVHDPLDDSAELWPEPEPADDRPNDASRHLAACLQPLLAQLPALYRDAVERVDLHGQTHHEAAQALGISDSGMKSRVQRGRHQLKDLLTQCCQVQLDRLGAVTSYRPNASACGCQSRPSDGAPDAAAG
jgi:RNA polymerase sigma-70 factor (ECF subfamily)